MPSINVLQHQPDFPNEDLCDSNAPLVEYYLRERPSDISHAEYLGNSLIMVHHTGHYALRLCGIDVDYSEQEYLAFSRGFAAFEYMSLLVNPRQYNGSLAVRNTSELLVDAGDLADLELANRRKVWPAMYPNAFGVIASVGSSRGQTMKQLHAATLGAQVACELQMTA